MGRPIDVAKRSEQQDGFLAAYAETGIMRTACERAGIHPPRHYKWLDTDPQYARRFAEVEERSRHLAAVNRKPHGRGYKVGGSRPGERERKQDVFLGALARTGIVVDAAREAGMSAASFYNWCREYPEFNARAQRVLEETADLSKQVVAGKISRASKAMWDDPGRREAWGEHQRSSWTPEMRAAAAQRNSDRLADPEYREQWMAKAKAARPVACDNPSYFDQIDSPEKAYWLGFIATDGCVTGFSSGSLRLQVKLARKDREHLVLLHKTLKARRPIRDAEEWSRPPGSAERRKRPCSVLAVSSHEIVNALVRHGITPRKTDALQPWDGPAVLMPHYWRGVIDGDGTISISDDDIKIGLCGSDVLVEAFREWAQSICGTTAKARQGKAGNRRYWLLYIGGVRQVPLILAALYDDAPVALARKKALADLAVHGKPLQSSLF